jgi:exopolysaccharide production protein ExoZ
MGLDRLAAWFELGTARDNRLLPMEGLRGLAVALVFAVHYCGQVEPYLAGPMLALATALHQFGNLGVDLFFMLSGYLIYGTLIARRQPFAGFIRRRIQRLYPAFLVVLVLYLGLSLLLPAESKLPQGGWQAAGYILANLLLLPGILDIQPIITVAWSLSYEMAFYLAVPLLVEGLGWRGREPRVRILAVLAAVVAAQAFGLPHPRMGMFACGMILADLLPLLRGRLRGAAWLDPLALAAMAGYGAILLLGGPGVAGFAALFVACLLLGLAAFGHDGMLARGLSWRPLRWLGNMSYSYYLLHGLVLKALFFLLARVPAAAGLGDQGFWLLLPPAFALTLLGSAPLFLLVERPFSIAPAGKPRAMSAAAGAAGIRGRAIPAPPPG